VIFILDPDICNTAKLFYKQLPPPLPPGRDRGNFLLKVEFFNAHSNTHKEKALLQILLDFDLA